MTKLKVAGLDPSLNNFGMVKGTLDLVSGSLELEELLLLETRPNNKDKKVVRKNSDDLIRTRLLMKGLTQFLDDVDLAFVEIPVGSQSARAMASYGMCLGVLGIITIPLIQVTAIEIKKTATGNKTASKQDMINWAQEAYPLAAWLTKKQHGLTTYTAKNEHLADALGAIYAGVLTDEFNIAKSFLTAQGN